MYQALKLKLSSALFAVILLACLTTSLAAQNFTSVVVFGDSLSDTGNIAHLTQSQFGIRFPSRNVLLGINYTDGRFTDGADTSPAASAYFGVWVEQLAASFPAKPAVKASLDGGTNYAYADATTNDGTRTESQLGYSLTLNNMGQQVTDYLATNPTPSATTLYVLWGGSNDVYADASAAGVAAAVAREAALVQRLINAGATQFLIPNLPPLGGVPDHASDAASAAALNMAAASFDAQLGVTLNGLVTSAQAQGKTITIRQPDVFARFSGAASNPAAIGLANVTSAAQGISGNPDTYLIWDGLHPTTTGHHFVAAAAAQLFTPLTGSTNVLGLSAASVAPGQSVTLTSTVKPSATSSSATPTGLVTFFNNGTSPIASATLVNGVATATFSGAALASSPYSITAVYAGDTTYNVSTSTAQALLVGTPVLSPTSTSVTSSAANGNQGAAITFTATVSSSASGTPTGTVTFFDGTTSLGAAATLSGGKATLTTSTLSAGTHAITATYSGDTSFMGSTSASLTQTITAPSLTTALSPTSITIARGSSGTSTLTLTPAGGYSGSATFSCGSLPAHLSCTFAPATLTFTGTGSAQTSTLTISTNATASFSLPAGPHGNSSLPIWAGVIFPGFGLLGLAGIRRRAGPAAHWIQLSLVLIFFSGALVGLSGCGGGSSTAAQGTYPVTVTTTAGSTTSTTTLTVVVQ